PSDSKAALSSTDTVAATKPAEGSPTPPASSLPSFSFGGSSLAPSTPIKFGGAAQSTASPPMFGANSAIKPFSFSFSTAAAATVPAPPAFSFGGGSTGGSLAASSAKDGEKPPGPGDGGNADGGGGDDDEDEPKDEQIDTAKLMRGAGEENEETLHEARTKAYQFTGAGKGWADVGLGIVKLNRERAGGGAARLILRADGSGRVLLNARVFAGMDPRLEQARGVSFLAATQGGRPARFLLKIKDQDASKALFESLKGLVADAAAGTTAAASATEVCLESVDSAVAAGGTTPSFGTVRRCKELLQIPIMVMIRPRGGDFVYTDEELEVMK
ncbi:hypothetical protein HK405_013330, partial [Cladochytrium tenue]